jgi:hypothetical protein
LINYLENIHSLRNLFDNLRINLLLDNFTIKEFSKYSLLEFNTSSKIKIKVEKNKIISIIK